MRGEAVKGPGRGWAYRASPCVLGRSAGEVGGSREGQERGGSRSQVGAAHNVIQPIGHAQPAQDKLPAGRHLGAAYFEHRISVGWVGSGQVFLPIVHAIAIRVQVVGAAIGGQTVRGQPGMERVEGLIREARYG